MPNPYIDDNGNLIDGSAIINPNNSIYNANGWGTFTNQNGKWLFNPNKEWGMTINRLNLFDGMNQAQQQGFIPFLQQQGIDPTKVTSTELQGLKQSYLLGKGNILGKDNSSDWSWFGKDDKNNSTFLGGTGMDWAKLGIGTGLGIWGALQQNKSLKLAQQNFEEQKALNHANYRMQARAYNNNLRNLYSGRGYTGMSQGAARQLGSDYRNYRAEETY